MLFCCLSFTLLTFPPFKGPLELIFCQLAACLFVGRENRRMLCLQTENQKHKMYLRCEKNLAGYEAHLQRVKNLKKTQKTLPAVFLFL